MSSDTRMPFLDHLRELRSRLVWAFAGIGIATVLALNWSSELFLLLTQPIRINFKGGELIGTSPSDAFVIKLKIALLGGLLLSLPNTFFQLWKFIEPGLHESEKRFTIPFVAMSTLCFAVGSAFSFTLVLPLALEFFLAEFQSIGVTPSIRIGEYLSFISSMIVVFGVVFELPVISYFLARVGIIDHQLLIRNGRFAIVGIFILAAILTPPDVVSQLCLAIPMLALYGICIGIAYVVPRGSAASASSNLPATSAR